MVASLLVFATSMSTLYLPNGNTGVWMAHALVHDGPHAHDTAAVAATTIHDGCKKYARANLNSFYEHNKLLYITTKLYPVYRHTVLCEIDHLKGARIHHAICFSSGPTVTLHNHITILALNKVYKLHNVRSIDHRRQVENQSP